MEKLSKLTSGDENIYQKLIKMHLACENLRFHSFSLSASSCSLMLRMLLTQYPTEDHSPDERSPVGWHDTNIISQQVVNFVCLDFSQDAGRCCDLRVCVRTSCRHRVVFNTVARNDNQQLCISNCGMFERLSQSQRR